MRKGVPGVALYSASARGLARQKGLTVPQVALAYLFAQPLNTFALVGCETADEFRADAVLDGLRL